MAQILSQLVGHTETVGSLLKALESERLASTLLFSGPSGIGKRRAALGLAQTLVCEREKIPGCGECGSCLRMAKGQSESLLQVAPDGAAIKIEQARDILQFISLRKLGRARVVIIEQAHLLNPQSGNALLKSLEEPPAGTYFILITSLASSVLPTIRSRSQLVRFKPLSSSEMKHLLSSEIESAEDEWVIEAAHGSVEVAKRLLENREDFIEIKSAIENYLEAMSRQFPVEEISRLRELMKEKSTQGYLFGLIQGAVRDAIRVQGGLKPSGQQAWKGAGEMARAFSAKNLSALGDLALAMESDVARNVDRGLVLENFALQWKNRMSAGRAR
jgi:DNA polymerase III subunit delta'